VDPGDPQYPALQSLAGPDHGPRPHHRDRQRVVSLSPDLGATTEGGTTRLDTLMIRLQGGPFPMIEVGHTALSNTKVGERQIVELHLARIIK